MIKLSEYAVTVDGNLYPSVGAAVNAHVPGAGRRDRERVRKKMRKAGAEGDGSDVIEGRVWRIHASGKPMAAAVAAVGEQLKLAAE